MKEKQQNIDATWQVLSSMTQEQANTLVITPRKRSARLAGSAARLV
ncbi:hypothetical protein ACLBOM_06570 [Escherichia coli]